jgi:AcrR family transcriptional regulator
VGARSHTDGDTVPTTATAPRANQRERILDAALELMSERGSAATSMRQLARACGVQVAAIYHYFDSKDALLRAVIDERRYSSRLVDLGGIDAQGSVEDRVRAVFDLFWRGALEEEPVLRLLLGEAMRNQAAALPTGSELLEVFSEGVRAALAAVAPELQDPDQVVAHVVAQVFTAFIRHVFDPVADVGALADHHAGLVVAALDTP